MNTLQKQTPEYSLTDQALISYLLSKEDGNMKGKVRTNEKCPVCGGRFVEVPNMALVCNHGTESKPYCVEPKRFYVDFWYKKRYKVYSDKSGQVLDSYGRANTLLSRIKSEIEDHTFDSTKYLKSEMEKFYTSKLLKAFREYKLTGDKIAPSYSKIYDRYVQIAIDHFGTTDVRDIRKIHIVNYQSYLSENYNWGNKTLKNCLDIFKTFLMYVKNDLELIDTVPHFPTIELDPPITTWLTQETQITVFSHVPDYDKPIIAFLMLTGCRPGEARALRCRDVDLEREIITISATFSGGIYRPKRKGKKSKPFVTPIHPEISEYIKHRVENNLPEAYMFTNRAGRHYAETGLLDVWRRVRDKAGLDKSVRLYDAVRHSFATRLINAGVPIYRVSCLLGHSDTRTTEKFYLHRDTKELQADVSNISLKEKVIKLKKEENS